MKLVALSLLLLLLPSQPTTARPKAPPHFEDFPVAEQFTGKPARVKFTSRSSRRRAKICTLRRFVVKSSAASGGDSLKADTSPTMHS